MGSHRMGHEWSNLAAAAAANLFIPKMQICLFTWKPTNIIYHIHRVKKKNTYLNLTLIHGKEKKKHTLTSKNGKEII